MTCVCAFLFMSRHVLVIRVLCRDTFLLMEKRDAHL